MPIISLLGIQSDDDVSNSMMAFWSNSGTESFVASPEAMQQELARLNAHIHSLQQKCTRLQTMNDSLVEMNAQLMVDTQRNPLLEEEVQLQDTVDSGIDTISFSTRPTTC